MGLKMGLLAAAMLAIAGAGTAKASVYSYTTAISGSSGITKDYVLFTPQMFQTDLGTLTGIKYKVNGTLGVAVYNSLDYPNSPAPLPLTFVVEASIYTSGLYPYSPGGETPNAGTFSGIGDGNEVQASGPVSASFTVPESGLGSYLPPNSGSPNDAIILNALDYQTGTNRGLPFDGISYQFDGQLTETFTYKPTHVPEPGSLALLGTALAMLGGAVRFRRRRKTT